MNHPFLAKLKRLRLGPQFAFSIALIFLGSIFLGGIGLVYAMQRQAEIEVAARAEILIQTANSVRNYTSTQIAPRLAEQLETEAEFISQTVPAYSAREVFEHFRQHPEYENFLYKEATLNPSNPRDLADPFEADLVERFRRQPDQRELHGYRNYQSMEEDRPPETDDGMQQWASGNEKWFYIARPLAVTHESCLRCHGNPADAPRSQIRAFGSEAGYNWQLNEIVAAQTIYVPANEVFARSRQYLGLVLGVLVGVSATVVLSIRDLLQRRVVLPIRKLTSFTRLVGAEQQSSTNNRPLNTQRLAQLIQRFDELGELARAFRSMALEIQGREADLTQMVQARTAQLAESTRMAERARQQAEQANQSKSQFLANMSHELRTPLNAILGFAQIINRDKSLNPQNQRHLNTILRSGEHLLALINDVLDMAKIEAGRVTLNETVFNLHCLLDSLEAMFQLKCKEKGLQLYFRRSQNVPEYVESDESKLRQILINLLGNAVKFTHRGTVILSVSSTLSPMEVGDLEAGDRRSPTKFELAFEVTDTGVGIPQGELEAIFEPFVQTKSSRITGKGTGLGLAISRQFVRIMGGQMRAASEVGQGSRFYWHVVAKPVRPAAIERARDAYDRVIGLAAGQAPYRILVVDDRPENRELLLELLRPIGFEVKTATDGRAGVDCWQTWQPHLIWIDIRMPGMDGLEATRQIRILEKRRAGLLSQPRTVIIALTASTLTQERDIALASGCDDFMRKPFLASRLFERMAHWLKINYIYEESEAMLASREVMAALEGVEASDLVRALKDMSDEWLASVEVAVRSLDYAALVELVEALSAKSPQAAKQMKAWVDGFAYDRIADAIDAIEQYK